MFFITKLKPKPIPIPIINAIKWVIMLNDDWFSLSCVFVSIGVGIVSSVLGFLVTFTYIIFSAPDSLVTFISIIFSPTSS